MPRCDSCNSRFSSNEKACPVCGEAIAVSSPARKTSKGKKGPKQNQAGASNLWLAGSILGGCAIIGAVILAVFLLSHRPAPVPEVAAKKIDPVIPVPVPAAAAVPAPPPEDSNLRGIEERIRAQVNLQQLGLATHYFHDTFGQFPPEMNPKNTDPKSGMSWMTGLLPFVDQTAVYQSISKEEAWNAPINQQAIKTVIPGFLHKPGVDERDANGYGTANYAGNVHVFGTGKPFKMPDFVDGATQTFIAGTVASGYRPWADPANVRDVKSGLNGSATGFGLPKQDRVLFLMGDGSVREVANNISPQVLEGISQPADGKISPSGF